MKNILLLLFAICLGSNISFGQETKPAKNETDKKEIVAQPIETVDGPIMALESNTVDYGEIIQNSEPLRKLTFTNNGNAPLVIKNARGSCGCTVPAWPKEPIMPGESSEIEIRYSTNRLGKINKNVTITTNEAQNNKHVIKVVGMIHKEEEGVPASKPSILGGGN